MANSTLIKEDFEVFGFTYTKTDGETMCFISNKENEDSYVFLGYNLTTHRIMIKLNELRYNRYAIRLMEFKVNSRENLGFVLESLFVGDKSIIQLVNTGS